MTKALREAQTKFARLIDDADLHLELVYSFLSVTEAGLYHITAQLAAEAEARGGLGGRRDLSGADGRAGS
jgi:hypothetical protein